MLTFIEGGEGGEEEEEEEEDVEVDAEESRAQATAWFAPFPPKPVSKDVTRRVSPAEGMRGVRVMKSMFREPITAIVLGLVRGDMVDGSFFGALGEGVIAGLGVQLRD